MAEIRWSQSRLRYYGENGKPIPEKVIRGMIDKLVAVAQTHLTEKTQRLRAGTLDLAAWQIEVKREIKLVHLASGMIAHGGRTAMGPSDWGFLGQILRTQYDYLARFVKQLEAGIDGRAEFRTRLYASTARDTFQKMRDKDAQARQFNQERNVLGANERHCAECPVLTEKGWVPAGTLPGLTRRICSIGCHCLIERRRSRQRAA